MIMRDDPEEDDVEAGDQHRARQERPQLGRLLRPAQRRVAPQRRREPGVEHVVVLPERRWPACPRLRSRLGRVARDVDVARVVVPRRNAMAPPELARNAPVAGRCRASGCTSTSSARARSGSTPARRRRGSGRLALTACRQMSLNDLPGNQAMRVRRGLGHRDEPLIGQHRLDDFAAAPAARHDHPVRLFADQQSRGLEVGEHRLRAA